MAGAVEIQDEKPAKKEHVLKSVKNIVLVLVCMWYRS